MELGLICDSFCSFRNQGVFPNLIGNKNLNDISFYLVLRSYSSYQHSRTFLCDLFIPKCDPESNKFIPPCREICHDYFNGCGHIGRKWSYLPSSGGAVHCLDKKVTCSLPGLLTDGKYSIRRSYSIEYFCNDGFTMEGNNTIFCMYNGKWSSERPVCFPNPTST